MLLFLLHRTHHIAAGSCGSEVDANSLSVLARSCFIVVVVIIISHRSAWAFSTAIHDLKLRLLLCQNPTDKLHNFPFSGSEIKVMRLLSWAEKTLIWFSCLYIFRIFFTATRVVWSSFGVTRWEIVILVEKIRENGRALQNSTKNVFQHLEEKLSSYLVLISWKLLELEWNVISCLLKLLSFLSWYTFLLKDCCHGKLATNWTFSLLFK